MIQIRQGTRTLICIGSGGVGKTTMAASLAADLARSGKKILVLTIDPSQRLAQALGVKPDGKIHRVPLPQITGAAQNGELWSSVIDHQETFAWFLRSAAGKDSASVQKMLQNRLYQQLSGRLSGSQEFTSLISLYRHVSSGEFDLVVLDTPPSQHTWNFLKAPEKISALFNEGVASWFRDAGESQGMFRKILNMGTAQVLKALETLTGSLFMKELGDFFRAIQTWQQPLEKYIMQCHHLLTSSETEFILVTSLDSSRIFEAQKLAREIQKQGYRLNTVIINRIPQWIHSHAAGQSARLDGLADYYAQLEAELQTRLGRFGKMAIYRSPEQPQSGGDIRSLLDTADSIRLL